LIEAFEIGVSLALRDGVSESIAQAQRNMEALRKTVDANGLSVRALRDAGIRAVSLMSAQPKEEKGQRQANPRVAQTATAQTAPVPDITSRSVQSDSAEAPDPREPSLIESERTGEREPRESPWDRLASAPVNVRSEPRAIAREQPRIDDALPQLQTVAPFGQSGEQGFSVVSGGEQSGLASSAAQLLAAPEGENAMLPALPPAAIVPGYALQMPSSAQSGFASMSAGGLQRTGLEDWAPAVAERVDTTPQGSLTESVAQLRRADSGTLTGPFVTKPAAPDVNRMEWHPWDSISSRNQEMDDPGASGDWNSSLAKLRAALPTTLSSAQSEPESVAPQGRGNAEGPAAGDVFLDGVLVGRWISRFLRREAERAESGPTGFDAKRGRLLPGVTVGG